MTISSFLTITRIFNGKDNDSFLYMIIELGSVQAYSCNFLDGGDKDKDML